MTSPSITVDAKRPGGHGGTWARLFGYDIFISFALGPPPRGSRSYASDLALKLRERGFTVFFSEDEAEVGGGLDNTLRSALHRSRVLVVIANRGTLAEPRWVRTEVEEFRRKHPSRAVVPISIDGALQDPTIGPVADAWLGFGGRIWIDETREAGDMGMASDDVVARLVTAPRAVRSAVRLRAMVVGIILFFAGLAGYAWIQRDVAVKNEDIAKHEKENAEKQKENAETQRDKAKKAEAKAKLEAVRADKEAVAARKSEKAEREQRQLAEGRLATATSRQFAAQSSVELQKRVDRAFALAAQSAQADRTLEALGALLNASMGLSVPLLGTLNGHSSMVTALAFDADGTRLLSSGAEGLLVVWNLRERRVQATMRAGPLKAVTSLALRPDGKQVVVGTDDGEVIGWDLTNAKRLPAVHRMGWRVGQLKYSLDGRWLHAATPRNNAVLRSVDLSEAGPMATQSRSGEWSRQDFDPDVQTEKDGKGGLIVIAGDPPRRVHLQLPAVTRGIVNDAASSRDRAVLALAHPEGYVSRWNLRASEVEPQVLFHGTNAEINVVAVSPDGRDLASGSKDGTIRFYDIERNRLELLRGHLGEITALAFSPDGKTLVSGGLDGAVMLWSVQQAMRREWPPLPDNPEARAARFATRALLNTGSGQALEFEGVDGLPRTRIDLAPHRAYSLFNVRSPDGQYMLLVGDGSPRPLIVVRVLAPHRIRAWPLPENQNFETLALANGGERVAFVDSHGRTWLIDPGRRAPLARLDASKEAKFASVAFSDDARRLVAATDEGMTLLDARNGRTLTRWPGSQFEYPRSVAIDAKGKQLALVSADEVLLWREPFTTSPVARLPLPLRAKTGPLQFSSDGERLYVGERKMLTAWHLPSNERLDVSLEDGVAGWHISKHGNWLLTRREDGNNRFSVLTLPFGHAALIERACTLTHEWAAHLASQPSTERPPPMPACRIPRVRRRNG